MKSDQLLVHERNPDPYARNVEGLKWRLRNKIASSYSHGRVLDVGCGYGYSSVYHHDYTGIDVDAETISEAQRIHPDARFVIGSANKLPFPDACFDTVLCLEVVEHLEDLHAFFSEIKRVMKPGALLIISTPNPNPYPNPYHYREIAYYELRDYLSDGFCVLRAQGYSIQGYVNGVFVFEGLLTMMIRARIPDSVVSWLMNITASYPSLALNYFCVAQKEVKV